ncbi:MAG: hypothetical protein U1E39_16320 [Planctomycetota bacterium]
MNSTAPPRTTTAATVHRIVARATATHFAHRHSFEPPRPCQAKTLRRCNTQLSTPHR